MSLPLQDIPVAARSSCGRVFRILLDYPRSRVWLRFGLVGLVNTGFGYTVFAILVLAGIWPGVALIGTMAAAVAFNFQTSRRLVFRSNGSVLRFVAVYIVVLAVNWATLRLLQWYGLTDLEAQAFLTLPVAVASFVGQRHFVFGAA